MSRLLRVVLIVGATALVVYALSLWGLFTIMSPGAHTYLETRSSDGRLAAHLERPGGSMEPIYYSVRLTGAQDCTAITLRGYQAERWIRLAWDGATLVVRYALPDDPGAKAVAPTAKHGADGCHGVNTRIVEDPSLAIGGPLGRAIDGDGNGA